MTVGSRSRLSTTGSRTGVPTGGFSSAPSLPGNALTATERMLLVSFASHGVAAVVDEQDRALTRGIRVDLVLETQPTAVARWPPAPGPVCATARRPGHRVALAAGPSRRTSASSAEARCLSRMLAPD